MQKDAAVVGWRLFFTAHAEKDAGELCRAGLRPRAERLFHVLGENPFQTPPPYEELVGDLAGAYSRRIDIRHRLIYQVLKRERSVKVLRMYTYYE
jgi:Txe/YoeB family toxin of toxin-antitoxin system